MLLLPLTILTASLILLFWSAHKMLSAAIDISTYYHIPHLIIGIVIIGFATSSPEIAVSALAAGKNQTAMAVGNAFGSNISNLLLVFGITACMAIIHTHRRVITYLFPLTLIATILPGVLMFNLTLSRVDGIILITALAVFMYLMAKKEDEPLEVPIAGSTKHIGRTSLWLFSSLILLLIASEGIVRSAVEIADFFGVSKLVIGLTIVALGTSLPEIATSIIGIYRHHHNIVVGNILGSNVFNSLAVLGIAALVGPAQIPAAALSRDFIVMIAATLLMWLLFAKHRRLTRSGGLIALIGFFGYITYLFTQT